MSKALEKTKGFFIKLHLKKLFMGIQNVEVLQPSEELVSFQSTLGEVVVLKEKVKLEDELESWLIALTRGMVRTLQGQLIGSLGESAVEVSKYAGQILCLTEEIRFTQAVESRLQSRKLGELKKTLLDKLEKLTLLASGASKLISVKLKSMILDIIHQISIVDSLESTGTSSLEDWEWFKQLKASMNSSKTAEISMCKATFDFSYYFQLIPSCLFHNFQTFQNFSILLDF
jgi:dynein heavy chain 2, cytosolic